jgi:flavin reductase (DIM6/NTAB) family NADH-FMN oxidoreductase RutF
VTREERTASGEAQQEGRNMTTGTRTERWNPSDQRAMRDAVASFPTGVVVITGMTDDGPRGFTCQSFVGLSQEPPLIAFAPALSSSSWPSIQEIGRFCVNILAHEQNDVAHAFATRSKRGSDKFIGIDWENGPQGSPRLAGAHAWIDCTLEDVRVAGDHSLVVGRVIDLEITPGEPLVYHRRTFGRFVS